jgi:hypothetical protein
LIDWKRVILSKKGKIVASVVITVVLSWTFALLSTNHMLPIYFGKTVDLKFDVMGKTASDFIYQDNQTLFFDFFRALVSCLLAPLIIGSLISGSIFSFEGHGWKSAGKNTLYSMIVFCVSLAVIANTAWPFEPHPTMIGLLVGEVFTIGSTSLFFYLPTGIVGFLAEKTWRVFSESNTGKGQKTPKVQVKPPQQPPLPKVQASSLEIPKGFNKIRQLGGGGFADVVLAKDKKKEVILKLIRNPDTEKAKAIQEAQIQYNLGHRNIVQVYDLIMDPLCIVEEYCEGGNLLDQVSTKPLTEVVKLLANTGISIGGALWVIHNCGYVHLDIKPENILFKKDGKDFVPKLSDFGTAKALGSSGGMTCTPMYLPPNYQLPIDTTDRRLDIYQLGLSLYFPLAACALRKSNLEFERLKLNPIFLSSQCPEIPPELDTVLQKAINVRGKDFSKAYQNAKEFADDLGKVKIT